MTFASFKIRKVMFNEKNVTSQVDKAQQRGLKRFGGAVRTTAIRSIRPARQKTDSELTFDEWLKYDRALHAWRRGGNKGRKPKKPLASAVPGEPPRSKTGILRKTIFFSVNDDSSVIIGPKTGKAKQLDHLEKGGTARQSGYGGRKFRMVYDPHPFMKPAFDSELPKAASFFTLE